VKLDTTILAETPEGIDMRLHPAGAVPRMLAYALDLLIRGAIGFATIAALEMLRGIGSGLALIVYFLLEWIYPVVFELMPGSATPGKRALGLQVTMESGLPVTPSASVSRNLLRVVDFMPFAFGIGLASMLLRRDFKRVGDIAAGTLVVHRHRASGVQSSSDAVPIAPRTPLTRPQQIALLQLAARAPRLTTERVDELAALAEAVLPLRNLSPGGAAPPPIRTGPRLLAVAQWLQGQR
jgi:uncharacterized RDD family membrane protein YckC